MTMEWDTATLEQIFSLMGLITLIGWAVLVLLPRRWWAAKVIPALIVPSLVAIAYVVLIATSLGGSGGGDFNSLAGVRQLFTSDAALLAGWLHYLAFDLVVGTIIARQADDIGMNRILQVPFLLLTLMFGPAGYLAFQLVRGGTKALGKSSQKV
ncbi:ABA4-like family protein [Parvularcula sp. IMCC14364]|uniref:ABA4-like family protein n=1 Tax=Parvularcula sp. IMCC14364 TaxID=3067902 RepID=UPI002741E537|nr:ABA4-like family protein [Parvularcula sp. IMCC14364]